MNNQKKFMPPAKPSTFNHQRFSTTTPAITTCSTGTKIMRRRPNMSQALSKYFIHQLNPSSNWVPELAFTLDSGSSPE